MKQGNQLRIIFSAWLLILFLLTNGSIFADAMTTDANAKQQSAHEADLPYLHPFSSLTSNLLDTFSGYNLLYSAGAIVSALVMIHGGLDDDIRNSLEPYPILGRPFTRVMLRVGDIYGLGLSSAIYFTGLIGGSPFHTGGGAAALQALGVASGIIGAIKLTSGRPIPWQPNPADQFDFFDYKNNVGNKNVYFPSGHTGTTLAVGAALASYYHDSPWVAWLTYPAAALMGYAMAEGRFHWGSDIVAGALISFVIGYTTGKNFRSEYDKNQIAKRISYQNRHDSWRKHHTSVNSVEHEVVYSFKTFEEMPLSSNKISAAFSGVDQGIKLTCGIVY